MKRFIERARAAAPAARTSAPTSCPTTGATKVTARRAWRWMERAVRPIPGLRRVRWPLRPRDARPRASELEAAFREAWADPAFRAELDAPPAGLRRAAVDPHRVPQPRRSHSVCGCCSSGRTSTTPARTRSTTSSARPCSPGAWARGHRRDRRRSARRRRATAAACSASSARSTWARSTSSARRSTCSACAARRRGRGRAPGSRTLKDAVNEACATGSPPSRRPTTASAR